MTLGWWALSLWQTDPVMLFAWVGWFLLSLTLHELAHGYAAIHYGDTTPRDQNRLTFNPLVHMGTASMVVFALAGIGWGAMPINPHRLRGKHADAIVAFAGPATNLALSAILIVAGALFVSIFVGTLLGNLGTAESHIVRNVWTFLWVGATLNLALALFNLIPAPPMDGYRILASFDRRFERLFAGEHGQFLAIGIFAAVFLFAGPAVWSYAMELTRTATAAITGLLTPDVAFTAR